LSFPNIPNITPTISVTVDQTVPLLLASIALEELALAHIMNAEAEKLQFVLGTLDTGTTLSPPVVTLSNLLAVDSSVQRTLRDVIKKEMLLEFKFENILDLLTSTTSTPGSISISPVSGAGATCGATLPISGTLLGSLGIPLANAQVNLAVTGASTGANVSFATTTPITDINGNFTVLGTFSGVPGSNFVTITAFTTIAGVTVSTTQTINFVCP